VWCGWDLTEICGVAGNLKEYVVWLGPYRNVWCGWDLTEIYGVAGNLKECVVWLGPYRSVWCGWGLTEVCPVATFRFSGFISSISPPDIRIEYM
jgi:hypothetical protein